MSSIVLIYVQLHPCWLLEKRTQKALIVSAAQAIVFVPFFFSLVFCTLLLSSWWHWYWVFFANVALNLRGIESSSPTSFNTYAPCQCVQQECSVAIKLFFWKLVRILLALIIFYKMITDHDVLLKFWFQLVVLIAGSLAVLMQAALRSRAACTRMARLQAIKPLSEIKIWLKCHYQ